MTVAALILACRRGNRTGLERRGDARRSSVAVMNEALTKKNARGRAQAKLKRQRLSRDDRRSAGLEIVAMEASRRHAFENDEASAHDLRRQRKYRGGRRQRRRSHGRCPAQRAAVMIAMMLHRNARMPARRGTEARRYDAGLDTQTAVGVMVQNRDRKLHAEGYQRQPDQVRTGSRSLHRVSSFPGAMTRPSLCHYRGKLPWAAACRHPALTGSKPRLNLRRGCDPGWPSKDAGGRNLWNYDRIYRGGSLWRSAGGLQK